MNTQSYFVQLPCYMLPSKQYLVSLMLVVTETYIRWLWYICMRTHSYITQIHWTQQQKNQIRFQFKSRWKKFDNCVSCPCLPSVKPPFDATTASPSTEECLPPGKKETPQIQENTSIAIHSIFWKNKTLVTIMVKINSNWRMWDQKIFVLKYFV